MKSSSKKDYDHLFKLVLIGDTGVGKSSILLRFIENSFSDSTAIANSIGVDFRFANIKIGNKTIKLQIWDTAGQERYKTITSAYYRSADGIIVIYDSSNESSFNHINPWIQEVDRYVPEGSAKIIVGNKIDKENEKVISTEKAKDLAASFDIPLVESSAKTGECIENIFRTIAESMLSSKDKNVRSVSSKQEINIIDLNDSNCDVKKKRSCC